MAIGTVENPEIEEVDLILKPPELSIQNVVVENTANDETSTENGIKIF